LGSEKDWEGFVERLAIELAPALMRRLLTGLTEDQVDNVREVLLGVVSQYYKRLMSSSNPYVRRGEFEKWLYERSPEGLDSCLSILSVLNQSKAYLYWCRDWLSQSEDEA